MLELQNIFQSIQSILCLNGQLPNKNFFLEYEGLPLIACDGAGSSLIERGLQPKTILGDLDSLDKTIIPDSIEILHTPDQSKTDFEKALNFLQEKDLLPCLVCGATGKETDHTLNNINIIYRYSKQYPMIFYDSATEEREKYGIFVFNHLSAALLPNTILSILPFPTAIVSTQGLKWNLNNHTLSQETKSSARNRVQSLFVEILVHQGATLIMFEFP